MPRKRLLLQYLESISGRTLEQYPTAVRDLIKGRAGVYALYRHDRLYYVGLAKNLMGRIKTHLKDRHHGLWDRFSVYLTVDSEHMKELESLVLRVVSPTGNRVKGKFPKALNLVKRLEATISSQDADNRAILLGGAVAKRRRLAKTRGTRGSAALYGLNERRIQLRARHNGKTYKASLRTDGTISYGGKRYTSLTSAARPIAGRTINGWYFWHFKKGSKWLRLREIRK